MKKVALLLALALSSTMVFAGCVYTNQTETATEVEGVDLINTTWVLTNFDMKPPVKPSEDGSLETSDEVSPESGHKPPSGEEIAEYLNVSLEFGEDGNLTFISNNGSLEMNYFDNHTKKDGNCYISITGENINTLTGTVENDTMSFNLFGMSTTFTKQ